MKKDTNNTPGGLDERITEEQAAAVAKWLGLLKMEEPDYTYWHFVRPNSQNRQIDEGCLINWIYSAEGQEALMDKVREGVMDFEEWFTKLMLINTEDGQFGEDYPVGTCAYRDVLRDCKEVLIKAFETLNPALALCKEFWKIHGE